MRFKEGRVFMTFLFSLPPSFPLSLPLHITTPPSHPPSLPPTLPPSLPTLRVITPASIASFMASPTSSSFP